MWLLWSPLGFWVQRGVKRMIINKISSQKNFLWVCVSVCVCVCLQDQHPFLVLSPNMGCRQKECCVSIHRRTHTTLYSISLNFHYRGFCLGLWLTLTERRKRLSNENVNKLGQSAAPLLKSLWLLIPADKTPSKTVMPHRFKSVTISIKMISLLIYDVQDWSRAIHYCHMCKKYSSEWVT